MFAKRETREGLMLVTFSTVAGGVGSRTFRTWTGKTRRMRMRRKRKRRKRRREGRMIWRGSSLEAA
jgi:hypothetical protein